MNYVVLNGVKSNTVKGLLIQALPPVSKPKMRTEVTEIDGRDGDIVTKLGYSAYDKQMEIGLYGDFDINDVISYFDSEGTVTFSNEPDKFYNYQIIKEIDFERLARFRTATVTFHVQPFKYSAIEHVINANIDQFKGFRSQTSTNNGVTVTASDNQITISGSASSYTEFYVPINATTIGAGSYSLLSYANGSGSSACSVRLIQSAPSDAQSFGNTYYILQDGESVKISATTTAAATYNFLWFYIAPNTQLSVTLEVNLLNNSVMSTNLVNLGNTFSKPIVDIVGSGAIELYLNGNTVLNINLGTNEGITVDALEMNAYNGTQLMNRYVTGDYDNLAVPPGNNTLSWSGTVLSIEITDVSRWL